MELAKAHAVSVRVDSPKSIAAEDVRSLAVVKVGGKVIATATLEDRTTAKLDDVVEVQVKTSGGALVISGSK